MYYIVETSKPFAQAAEDLDAAVKAHQFGVERVSRIVQAERRMEDVGVEVTCPELPLRLESLHRV